MLLGHEIKYTHENRKKDGVGHFLWCKPRLFGKHNFYFCPDGLDDIIYKIDDETATKILRNAESGAQAAQIIAEYEEANMGEG
jgi:hypothetical protein